ncbi:excitatory amino acid transporter 3-like [Pempheris klunzingeri]|uniref:excitatory amino acid transporter 3-like n=1 Tax=Pempheris klunzingeri TaxID=3127111 RepID=UPI003981103E
MEAPQEDTEADQRSADSNNTCCSFFFRNMFQVASLGAVGLGLGFGIVVKTYLPLSDLDKFYIGFPGEILMRMLQFIIVPIIVSSVVTGVCGLSADTNRKIATRATVYFVFTTLMSVTIGFILVLLVKPGAGKHEPDGEEEFFTVDAMLDLVRNMIPGNLILVCFQQNATEVRLDGHYVDGANSLGLIVCSFVFGLTLKKMEERGKIVVDLLNILNETTKYVVNLILCYWPIGVLFMSASYVVEIDDWGTVYKLGKFMAVVVIGLMIHGVIVLPMVYLLWARQNPWAVIKGVSPALRSALVSSRSATQLLILQCCEKRNKINHRITGFMLPIGTNVNMDGTALYEVMAVVFIAQLNDINLNLIQIITIGVIAAVSSLGTAEIPSTEAVITFFVLTAVGLPAKEASVLVVVEWLLDRCNTIVNILGNCIGMALVNQLSKKELQEMEEQDRARTRTAPCLAEDEDSFSTFGSSVTMA